MAQIDTQVLKKILGIAILIAVAAGGVNFFLRKQKEDQVITYSTSDAKDMKGEISIVLDSWIGYFPFRSPVFGSLMRKEGYRIKIIDDRADYPGRMKMLKKGKVNFAVCTVDSYLLNGKEKDYPGVIAAVIDESKGGDALVGWKGKVANIEQLKKAVNLRIAFTPSSPSEHLLKSIAVHFDVPMLRDRKGDWRVEVDGAEEAYKKLMKRDADLAAVWEPHVTEALSDPGVVKLLGSEDIENLIVDILLVERKFAGKEPALVKLMLRHYFDTINIYAASPNKLKADIIAYLKLSEKQVDYMLKGVRWVHYPDNLRWFGLPPHDGLKRPEIVESINSTVTILLGSRDFESSPLPDNDPYTLLNSSFLKDLFDRDRPEKPASNDEEGNSLTRKFSKLDEKEWDSLKRIGSLKLRPISFRDGTDLLDDNGRGQVREIVNSIRHYPNFRILIKGHTGLRGDTTANMQLSLTRAREVRDELVKSFGMDPNRIRVTGMGSKEPLTRQEDESERSYNNRLKRVEIHFLSKS